MRLSTVLKGAAVIGVALAVTLIAAVKAIDFNKYKDFLAQQVLEATGRQLTIAGTLELKPGLVPLVVANGISLTNLPGGSHPEMIKVERIEAEIALLPLLKREIRVQRLVLNAPTILLENGNWQMAVQIPADPSRAKGVPPTRFSLRELKIKNARVSWRDPAGRIAGMNLHKLTIMPDQGPAGALAVQAIGDYQGRGYDMSGKVGSLAALNSGKPWPVQMKAALPGLNATIDGTVADPQAMRGIDVKLTAQGDELAEIARLSGVTLGGRPIPAIGPFKLAARLGDGGGRLTLSEIDAALGKRDIALISAKGTVKDVMAAAGIELILQVDSENLAGLSRLAGRDIPSMGPLRLFGAVRGGGSQWSAADLRASLAGSDLAGEATLNLGKRPLLVAKLHSTTLALTDFTTPAAKHGEKLEPKAATRPGSDGRLFSAEAPPLGALRALDAAITLHVGRLIVGPSPLTDFTMDMKLRNGRLIVAPMTALLGGGQIEADAVLDAAGRPDLALNLSARQIELGRLVKESGSDLMSGGRTDLRLALTGSGESPRDLMASASGDVMLKVGEGRIHNRAIDWTGGDMLFQVLGALNPLAKSDDTTEMSCAVAHFVLKDGIATADRGIAVETAKVDVVGAGTVDLRSEAVDFGIKPRARDGLGLSLGGPLAGLTRLGGTLAQPRMTIDEIGTAKAAASVGAAVATGGLSLLGELLFDKVTADTSPCRTALGGRAVKAKPGPRSGGGLIEGLFGR
jgi:uncharacterized protein involved in outer membrane biogenesis